MICRAGGSPAVAGSIGKPAACPTIRFGVSVAQGPQLVTTSTTAFVHTLGFYVIPMSSAATEVLKLYHYLTPVELAIIRPMQYQKKKPVSRQPIE